MVAQLPVCLQNFQGSGLWSRMYNSFGYLSVSSHPQVNACIQPKCLTTSHATLQLLSRCC